MGKAIRVAILLAACLGLASPGCQTRPPKKKTAIQLSLDALEKAGVKAYEEGRYTSSLRLFRESEALARSTDNLVALANAYNNLGATLKEMGEIENASAVLTDALRLNEALNLDDARAVNLANLASLEIDRKKTDLSRARAYNRRARSLFRETGNEIGSVLVRNNEGRILLHQGRNLEAKKVFDEALSDADSIEAARLRAVLLANRGLAHEEMGDLVKAQRDYEDALDLERELEVFTGVARNLEAIARVQIKRGTKGEAAKTWLRALDVVLLRVRWEPWIRRVLGATEKLLGELGRQKEAKDLRKRVEEEIERAKQEEERLAKARMHKPLGDR